MSMAGSSQAKSRAQRLEAIVDELRRFKTCGPSDDPDQQTAVIESYKYLLVHVKKLSNGVLPSTLVEEIAAVPSNIDSLYDVYESRAQLDVLLPDIADFLFECAFNPDSTIEIDARAYLLINKATLDNLEHIRSTQFDLTKLIGYCKEINSSFYHGNIVACLLLMRTVLNHVPPIFGCVTFAQVTANSGKSLRDSFEHLEQGVRKLADLYTHQPVRAKEIYPSRGQVEPFRAQFELLLHEIVVRVG
jgi:hypothetical protein